MVADQKGVSRTRFNSKYVGSVRGGNVRRRNVPAGRDFPVRTIHIVEDRRSGNQLESPERIVATTTRALSRSSRTFVASQESGVAQRLKSTRPSSGYNS
jgi:hypothetical protein